MPSEEDRRLVEINKRRFPLTEKWANGELSAEEAAELESLEAELDGIVEKYLPPA